METLIVGEGEGFLDLREVAKTIEKSTAFAQLLRKWKLFGEELNLKDDVIEDLQQRMSNGTYELSDLPRKMLKLWKASQGNKATLQKLCDALDDCGVRDITDTLKIKFNNVDSNEGPFYQLHDKVYTLRQLLCENASEEFIQEIQLKHKSSCATKPIPLLKEEVHPRKPADYYISRTFVFHTELHEEIFKDYTSKKHIFVVKGAPKSELARASGFKMIENSRNQLDKLTVRFVLLDQEEHFKKICKNTTNTNPVHMIEFKDGRYFWLKSTCGVRHIKNFLKTKSDKKTWSGDVFGEDTAVAKIISPKTLTAVCISDSPGMGKTVVLNSLALKIQETTPKAVIIFLVLQEFVKQFYKQPNSINIDCILMYATADYYKKLILQQMLQNSYQFYLFLDGYDEIFNEHLGFVDALLKKLVVTRNVKIILTTRKHLKLRVEPILNTLSFGMLPFSLLNQIDFLTGYWATMHGAKEGESLHKFAKKCLKTLELKMTDKERSIAGVPLQCMMLAEVYARSARQASKLEEPFEDEICIEELSIFHLYKSLVNLKFCKIPDSRTKQMYMDAHVCYSVALLYPDWLEKFSTFLRPQDDIEENTLFSIGLVEKSPVSSTPRFVHRTYAEFVFAEFIIKHLDKSEACIKFLIQQILAKAGVTVQKFKEGPSINHLNHSVTAYFLNMHLRDWLATKPAPSYSFNLRKLSVKDACIAALTCCCNDLESCFNMMANLLSHFEMKTIRKEMGNEYFISMLHLAVRNTKNVLFLQSVMTLAKTEFGVDLSTWVHLTETVFENGMFIPNCTPLHVAVRQGKYNIAMYLLQIYGQEVKTMKYLLHLCVSQTSKHTESMIEEKISIIEALTKLNKKWLEETHQSRTPLLEHMVHVRIVKHLIKLGANINAHSDFDGTVLHTVAGADNNSYTDLVRWAMNHGFHLVNCTDNFGATSLMRAIEKYGTVDDKVLQLFNEAGADLNRHDNGGDSVLFYAIRHSRSHLFIQRILDLGANLNHRNDIGRNAAHLILMDMPHLYYGNAASLRMDTLNLLKSRGFSEFNRKDKTGLTPLMAAIERRKLDDEILDFLHKEGVDFNAQDNEGDSVLFYAIRYSTNRNLLTKILDFGANPNHINLKNQNVGHWVILNYDRYKSKDVNMALEILKLVEFKGFEGFNQKNLVGVTPLKLAVRKNIRDDELLKFLHERTSL